MGKPTQRSIEIPRIKGGSVRPEIAEDLVTITRFGGEDMWFVLHDHIGWRPNPGDKPQYPPVQVPKGFVTDLASTPWYLWSWLPNDGLYLHAAIIHDWLYWDQARGRDRDEADNVLWIDMIDLKVRYWKRLAIYQGAHWGGQAAWDTNAALKASGEKRVLKRLPDDPKVSWDDWKKRPDVFV